jgi:hypothetical protein
MLHKTSRAPGNDSPARLLVHRRLLQGADVLVDGPAPAIHVRPLALADAGLVAGHIDHVALARGRGGHSSPTLA